MKKAREELGPEARLLSARRVSAPDLPAVYEVQVTSGPAEPDPGPGIDAIRQELQILRRTITSLKAEAPAPTSEPETEEPARDPTYEKWFDVLRRRGVGAPHAERIVEAALRKYSEERVHDPYEALNQVLSEQFAESPKAERPGSRSTILVGPTGAGKTTVLAKIAADLVRQGQHPVLVSSDGESLTGAENVQAIAEVLELEFATAFLASQMESIVAQFVSRTIFLVDTPGRTPFERDGLTGLKSLRRALPDGEILLVLPATTDGEEARLVLEDFQSLGVDRVILTKLDELHRPGRIVDLAKAVSRPIARITYGRAVQASSAPDDPQVVSRILGSDLSLTTLA
jgi:flagellar biosynthesis protein FlhF